jgi:hypothetical protein
MYYPTPEEHLDILGDLQWLRYYVKNIHTKITVDKVRDVVEKIRSNYGYIPAQPTRDALGLLEAGRYNDERIDVLFDVQLDVLEKYLAVINEYRDDHSILNDGWH